MQSRVWNCSEMVNRWLAVVFCIAIFAFTAKSNAQLAGNGSIQGSIADSTGAFIQNATVTATNTATQVKHTAVTQGNGLYSFPNLDIGTYTVEVTAQGFEHYSQSNIVLEVGSSIAVNVAMTVGRTDQKIEVQASGLALQTEDASFKQTIDQQTVTEMPLNGRQMTCLDYAFGRIHGSSCRRLYRQQVLLPDHRRLGRRGHGQHDDVAAGWWRQ